MKKKDIVGLVALLLACCVPGYILGDEYYRWVDENGVSHIANDIEEVPEEYLDQVKRLVEADDLKTALSESEPLLYVDSVERTRERFILGIGQDITPKSKEEFAQKFVELFSDMGMTKAWWQGATFRFTVPAATPPAVADEFAQLVVGAMEVYGFPGCARAVTPIAHRTIGRACR